MKKTTLFLSIFLVYGTCLHAQNYTHTRFIEIIFKDTTVTGTAGMTFKVGDSVHVRVFSDDELYPIQRYPPYPQQELYFDAINDPMPAIQAILAGEVTIYRNDTLLYAETDRIYKYFDPPGTRTDNNIFGAYVFVSKAFSAAFDIIGNIPNVNKKIRYGGKIHPHDSRIVDREITDVTLFVHGADTSDVPKYWYTWYKDDLKVDAGFNKSGYTVHRTANEDVSGYAVR
ncbi:MAG: hypothetical protein LBF08_03005, partial [Dysgonamonadaceae bacterium]|nr:hypothetical protein [Dysgonamonadaceae bacterium]